MPTPETMTQWRPIDDVVGDLHEVIDLGALADHRVAAGAAIDRGVGADLDIVLDDDPADLRHLQVPAGPHGEAETVLAEAGARMDDDAVAEERVGQGRAGADRAVAPDPHVGADAGVRADHGAGADLGTGADRRRRDRRGRRASRRASGWMWAPGATPAAPKSEPGRIASGCKPGEEAGIDPVGIAQDEGHGAGRDAGGEARRDEAEAGPGRGERVAVAGVVHVGDVVRRRRISSGRGAGDHAVGVRALGQRNASSLGDGAEAEGGGRGEEDRI